jgi:hypothetical protein
MLSDYSNTYVPCVVGVVLGCRSVSRGAWVGDGQLGVGQLIHPGVRQHRVRHARTQVPHLSIKEQDGMVKVTAGALGGWSERAGPRFR